MAFKVVKSALGYIQNVVTDIIQNAWGQPKVTFDYSIFHSLFKYIIDGRRWLALENGVEIDLSVTDKVVSQDGYLKMTTGTTAGDWVAMRSYRSPRYQPNRGHIRSTSTMIPHAGTVGKRSEYGMGTIDPSTGAIDDGVFFRIDESGNKIYAVARSKGADRRVVDITQKVFRKTNITQVSDLQKTHLADIQYQWRGAGDYFFYVDLKLVHTMKFLGDLDEVTISNPQLPCFYKVTNVSGGAAPEFRSGCVDISSEGGQRGNLTDATIFTEDVVTIPNDTNRHHLLVMRVKENFYGKINTRNFRILRLNAVPFGKDMDIGFGGTRDETAIGGTIGTGAFTDLNPFSSLEYIDMSQYTETEVSIDFTKIINLFDTSRIAGDALEISEPNPDLDLYLSGGDIVIGWVQNIKTGTGGEAKMSIENGEEV